MNETDQKYINIENRKILPEESDRVNDYNMNGDSYSRFSLVSSLIKNNRNREWRHKNIKKPKPLNSLPAKKDMGTTTEDGFTNFTSLLKDPMKIEKIISVLIDLKNDLINQDLDKIRNKIMKGNIIAKLQDFSGK